MSAKPITIEQLSEDVMKMLDRIVEEMYPEDERENAKAAILEAFGASIRMDLSKEAK